MAKSYEELKNEISAITNEVEDGANTANRIGGAMADIADYTKESLEAQEERINEYTDSKIAEGIVQETGDGENVVMSQKAVSEELSELGSEVNGVEFSKNLSVSPNDNISYANSALQVSIPAGVKFRVTLSESSGIDSSRNIDLFVNKSSNYLSSISNAPNYIHIGESIDVVATEDITELGLYLNKALIESSDTIVFYVAIIGHKQRIESLESELTTVSALYDVSAHNGGVTFASLEALLSDADLATLIPTNVRKGGMSIKFVKTSDNNYVQFRLMKNQWSTTPSDWQGVDDEPTAGSDNLVKSGGVEKITSKLQEDVIVNNKIVYPLITASYLRPMVDGYVHTNGVYSKIAQVNQGDLITIDFTIESGTYIRFGFTSVYPANGVAVTGYGDSGPQFHKIEKTAPFDGYLLMECASDFVELSVSKDNNGTIGRDVYNFKEDVKNLNDIVDPKRDITPEGRVGYYIKYSDSTLYDGTSSFSVTEPIEVHKGDRIVVIEVAINSSIAVISTCSSSLSNISAKVPSNAEHLNEPYTYEYFVEQDGYVSITFHTSYGTTIKIVNNINDKVNIIQEEVDALANQFADKNFGVDGDSITAGNQWSKIVADNLHLNSHHNVGVGGATWACNVVTYDGVDYTPQDYDDPNFVGIGTEAITDPTSAQQAANNCAKVHVQKFIAEVTAGTYPVPDIFCFSFGTNDFVPTQEQVNAAMSATDYPTGDALFNMAGAMRWCLQKIREIYPKCTIFVLLPIQRSWQKYQYDDGKSAKVNMIQKSDYIKDIAQDFGVQIIDMFHNCGINGCLEKDAPNYGPYLRDGLHPNNDGRKNMGNYATAIIKAFYFQQY